jgi:glycosyltransferase involved in cell wall biosynthesis
MAKKNQNKSALVIIPVLNEEKNLSKVIDGIPRKVLDVKIDILVVNDGSSDNSVKIAKQKKCLIINHKRNLGYGISVIEGFHFALKKNYHYIVKLDGDLQHDPVYVSTIIKILRRGEVDYVITSRYQREIDRISIPPIERRLVNAMCTGAINAITGLNLSDVFCGFFGLTRELLSKLNLKTKGYGLELEMILKAHFHKAKILEIPHPLIYKNGTSKFFQTFGGKDRETIGKRLEYYAKIILETLEELNIKQF